jgi:hypothetical protein
MVLEIGQFGKYIRNTWKVFRYGAGEGCRRSVGQTALKLKKSRRKGTSYIQHSEGLSNGMIAFCIGTAI